jgi:hypothetical protein
MVKAFLLCVVEEANLVFRDKILRKSRISVAPYHWDEAKVGV